MSAADDYNAAQLAAGKLTAAHVTALTKLWQAEHDLEVDGMAGPMTIASIESHSAPPAPPAGALIIVDGWLEGTGVLRMPAHPSWYGGLLDGRKPGGIVAHYTATGPGTAINMAKRRSDKFGTDPDDRAASWHVTIDSDGSIVQMVPFDHVAWHAGSSTAVKIPGLGWANNTTIGVELVGFGDVFTAAQVAAAKSLWRVLARAYAIPRTLAMVTHQSIDPTQREDPGPVWMGQHAPSVLAAAYEA